MLRSPRVLLLSTDETETALLQDLLNEHAILTPAGNLTELAALLKSNSYDALFCAWSFQRGTWEEAVRSLQESHPGLPVIVLSSSPENREWAEVLEAGAFDLLVPPYEEQTVLAVLEQASASREVLASWHRDPFLQAGA
jgi:two-component system, NarL family, nitrate/nitrite response regulator NarL